MMLKIAQICCTVNRFVSCSVICTALLNYAAAAKLLVKYEEQLNSYTAMAAHSSKFFEMHLPVLML